MHRGERAISLIQVDFCSVWRFVNPPLEAHLVSAIPNKLAAICAGLGEEADLEPRRGIDPDMRVSARASFEDDHVFRFLGEEELDLESHTPWRSRVYVYVVSKCTYPRCDGWTRLDWNSDQITS